MRRVTTNCHGSYIHTTGLAGRSRMDVTSLRLCFLFILFFGLYDCALHGSSLRTATSTVGSSGGITSSTPHQRDQELMGTFLLAEGNSHGSTLLDGQTWEQALSKGLSAALKGGYSGFVAGIIQVCAYVRTHMNEEKQNTQK